MDRVYLSQLGVMVFELNLDPISRSEQRFKIWFVRQPVKCPAMLCCNLNLVPWPGSLAWFRSPRRKPADRPVQRSMAYWLDRELTDLFQYNSSGFPAGAFFQIFSLKF